ncbi:MAG: YggS family pyridoxal phosphate-dependent enzyme [Fibrobacter sp.]|nr:YggS family pyridoxal phosphate-dependent enzyme [Fibrobacter sp.]
MIEDLRKREQLLRKRIEIAAQKSGRSADDVELIWVTKTHPVETVEAAIAAGAKHLGENRIQEAEKKFSKPFPKADLHIIGPVQSNKWRKTAQIAQWVHSVSRLKALLKFQEVCVQEDKEINVLFQINTSLEESKSGLSMKEAKSFILGLPELSRVHYRGLMTIGINTGVAEDSREGFAWLRQLRDEVKAEGGEQFQKFTELSMGMTGDLEVAVEEGSTMLRVGTALFGERNYK